ncbi:MAG TPA: hypothetical protein VJT72_00285 [Pseudonocardiaceae bacterium]|nr:hypothetical protein [Pseudonocardiaceae bacterium]
MYASDPISRPAGRPASATPLRDHLARTKLGVDDGYVVLPRSLAEEMPLPWQQQMAYLIDELHQTYGDLPWPIYRVVPSRVERLVDLDETQLAEAGYVLEIDTDGELVYRDRDDAVVTAPQSREVLVSCLDPIPRSPLPLKSE